MATKDKLGVASYELEVEFRDYIRDMKRAESETTRRTSSMSKAFDKVTSAGKSFAKGAAIATAATAAVGAGFLVLVRNALSAAEGIADMAKRANTTTASLQELRFAVTQNGGSIRDADDALVRLNRRMSLFVSTGAGPGALAFEKLNIAVTDANGNIRDSGDVFDEIAKKLGEMEDTSEQAAIASAAFGEDAGPRLVPLLKQGEEGIRAAREEARRLGIVLQDDAVQAAAEASAKFRALGETISAQFTAALIQAGPMVTDLADRLSQSLPTIIAWINALGQVVGLLDAPLEVQLSENVSRIRDAQAKVSKIEAESGARNPTRESRLSKAREELRQITLEQFEIQRQMDERAERMKNRKPPTVEAPSNLPRATGSGGGGGGGGAARALNDDARAAQQASRAFQQLTQRLSQLRVERQNEARLAKLSEAARSRAEAQIERQARETEILELAIRSGNDVTDEQIAKAMELARELENLSVARDDDARAEKDREKAMRDSEARTRLLKSETETLSRTILDAAFNSDGWKDALYRVGEAILQLESTQNFLAQSINAVFGVASSPTSSGGGIFETLIGGVGSALGGLFGGFFADGGMPPVGRLSVVGENGPELMVAGRASTVISNSQTTDLLGGAGRNVNAPFETNIYGVSAQEIMSKMEIRLKRHRQEIFEDMAQLTSENPDYG